MTAKWFRSAPGRRDLVVVRAGANWRAAYLDAPYVGRTWDLVVAYRDLNAYLRHEEAPGVEAIYAPGGKWQGVANAVARDPSRFDRYDYVWTPDDDIECSGSVVNRMFALMRQHGLAIAHPAFDPSGWSPRLVEARCAGFELRRLHRIGGTAPCLSGDVFRQLLPAFAGAAGNEMPWIDLCLDSVDGCGLCAVLDATPVKASAERRKRPVDARTAAVAFVEEALDAMGSGGNSSHELVASAIADDGAEVRGAFALAVRMARGYWRLRRDFGMPMLREIARLFAAQAALRKLNGASPRGSLSIGAPA